MAGKTPRRSATEKKKEQICARAMELFNRYGYEHTTLQDISEASGMSTGSIYNFFGSKEGVLMYAADRVADVTITNDHWDEKVRNPYDTLMEFLPRIAAFFEELGADLVAHLSTPFELRYNTIDGDFYDINTFTGLVRFISACQKAGTMKRRPDAITSANFLLSFVRGRILEWRQIGGSYSLTARVEEYLPRFLATFLPVEQSGRNRKERVQRG